MIAIIRIRGKVKIKKDIEETFNRLKLKRKALRLHTRD